MHFVGHRLLDNYLSNNYHTKTLYPRGEVKTPWNYFFLSFCSTFSFPNVKKKTVVLDSLHLSPLKALSQQRTATIDSPN